MKFTRTTTNTRTDEVTEFSLKINIRTLVMTLSLLAFIIPVGSFIYRDMTDGKATSMNADEFWFALSGFSSASVIYASHTLKAKDTED